MTERILSDAIDFSQIQRVLVVKLQLLGDVLLSTPVFSTLKQQHPHLEIDALVYAETAVMLQDNPDIAKVFCIDRNWKDSLPGQIRHEVALYRNLKNRDYQLLICLTDRLRGAWLSRLLKPRYSVALRYPYKRGRFWGKSFSHLYNPSANRHNAESQLDALRRLGLQPGQDRKLKMAVPLQTQHKIGDLLDKHGLGNGSFVVIHPTSRWLYKGWNVQGFAELIAQLRQHRLRCVMVSGPDSRELTYVQSILTEHNDSVVNLAGQLNLSELAGLISQARCFIGLDSVASHIAAAVGTPCVTLFGPSRELIWGPWQVPHRLVTGKFACRPCDRMGCGDSMISECLQSIRAEQVFTATMELIEANPR